MRLIVSLFLILFSAMFHAQKSSDTSFRGWPPQVHYITYRTSGVPDSLINYHVNGTVSSRFYYVNGKVSGKARSYYPSGKIHSEAIYIDGKANGPAVFYFMNGVKLSHGDMKNNKREGKWVYYDSTAYKSAEIFYKEGKREGKSVTFFDNGTIRTRSFFENDLLNDTTYEYYPSGLLKFKGCFRKGKMRGPRYYYDDTGRPVDGVFTWFHTNGKKEREGRCIKGLPEGEMKLYDKSERMIFSVNFKNGEPDGAVYFYNGDGKPNSIDIYKNGKFKKSKTAEVSGHEAGTL